MLIIFDLDDTLIDTSNSITPFQLKKTFLDLIENGLKVPNIEESLHCLLQIQRKVKKGYAVLENFLINNKADKRFFELGRDNMSSLLPDSLRVCCFPHVKKLLNIFSREHILCIVTRGEESYQRQKIQKAGIDCSLFSKIEVTREKDKKNLYKKLMLEFGSSEICVCGDNEEIDLFPAKELGGITIYTQESGRLPNKSFDHCIDYKVKKFIQMKSIIEKLER